MVQLALFTAIILLLAFTPIGFIKLPYGLSITVIGIPVIIGAITLGPVGGAILGAVFGLSSFAQAFGLEPFGTMLFSINPVGTFITTMIPRILMGWLTGLISQGLKKVDKTKWVSYLITSIAGSVLNTVLFMTSLMIFFYNEPMFQEAIAFLNASNIFTLIIAMVGVNAIAEAIAAGIIGTAIAKPIDQYIIKNII
ncbi:MAG: ECF transporter S component [Anaerolineaceae bacterium]|nr:MAG: ECF transporter S component [Anaerolineaceae bacterium]